MNTFLKQKWSDIFLVLSSFWKVKYDRIQEYKSTKYYSSYDVASESEITPCNKIDKPLVVYRFTGNVITSITTLRT